MGFLRISLLGTPRLLVYEVGVWESDSSACGCDCCALGESHPPACGHSVLPSLPQHPNPAALASEFV